VTAGYIPVVGCTKKIYGGKQMNLKSIKELKEGKCQEVLWLSLTNETNFCLKTHRLNGEIVHDFETVNLATVDRQINKMQTEYLRNGIDLVIMR
jgi:hypothetical protein